MVHPTESRCGLKQGSNYVAITVLTLGSFPGLNTHWVMLQAETRLKLCGNNSFDIGFFSWPEHCIITSRWQAAYICACQSASQKILSDLSDRATGRATNWVMSKDNIGIWLPEQKTFCQPAESWQRICRDHISWQCTPSGIYSYQCEEQGPHLQNILRQSYDYLTIMSKLRPTYDRRLIYKTSYNEWKAFHR